MLSIQAPGFELCDGLSRREILRVGGLGACGLSLPELLAGRSAEGSGGPGFGKAKACIVLFLFGGPPQHSTWDPKPSAPDNVRGEIAPISTAVPGVQFGELMPLLSARADKLAVLRAVVTGDNAHSSSGYYMLTGKPHVPMNFENANPGAPNDWPNWGAVLQRIRSPRGYLPAAVRLPMQISNTDGSVWPGQDGGMLGRGVDPWLFRCAPASSDYRIAEFELSEGVNLERLAARRNLARFLDEHVRGASEASTLGNFSNQQQRAFGLLSSASERGAFDLASEPTEIRERYGMTQFGQSCLLARKLVESGVSLVQVNWFRGPEEPDDAPVWDTHVNETERLKKVLLPPMDRAFAGLLDDLQERGLLDETLVVCLSEFGRTPRFNGRAGRDHWGSVFSIALAGGGIRGGVVHGASDELGAYPAQGIIRPEDLTATMFHCLGYAPHDVFQDQVQRPHPISTGQVIEAILA